MKIEFKDIASLVSSAFWPAVVLLLAWIYRKDIRAILNLILTRATKLSLGGASIELAANEAKNQVVQSQQSPEKKLAELDTLARAESIAKAITAITETVGNRELPESWVRERLLKVFNVDPDSEVGQFVVMLLEDSGALQSSDRERLERDFRGSTSKYNYAKVLQQVEGRRSRYEATKKS
jgi:hypothetical protein